MIGIHFDERAKGNNLAIKINFILEDLKPNKNKLIVYIYQNIIKKKLK